MKSFFLTSEFKVVPATENVSFDEGKSYTVVAGAVKKETVEFEELVKQVIANLEGGYYNPRYHITGDERFGASGETMFGIDRKTGGTINSSPEGVKFWKKIDEAQVKSKWKWNYIPPDPLQKELLTLVAQIIKPQYEKLADLNLRDKGLRSIIEQDGRLLFNFVYGVWNGSGWFQGFAGELSKAYKNGKTNPEDLLKLFVSRRINNENVLVRGNAQSSLINEGGIKIKKLVGLQ